MITATSGLVTSAVTILDPQRVAFFHALQRFMVVYRQ